MSDTQKRLTKASRITIRIVITDRIDLESLVDRGIHRSLADAVQTAIRRYVDSLRESGSAA